MNQTAPKISIITPVYNVERFLPECIESILAQSFREWELLLVDDGSTDRSGCICDEYAARDARIRVIHKPNTGVSDSRNIALREARADLIGYVDSDDWIDPEMYSLLYDNLMAHNADVSICGFYWEYRDQQIVAQESGSVRKYSGREAMELIFDDKVIKSYPCDKLFRRKVLTEDLPPRYFEDYATVIKWLANARYVVLDTTPCYHYRMRAGSTVHNTDPEKKLHYILAEVERFEIIEKAMNGASARNVVRSTKSIIKATRELVRDSSDTAVAMCYCRRIAAVLNSLPPVKLSDAGTKLFVRQWKLRHCVRWFVVSTRVDYWFRFTRYRKQHLLYD